METIKIHTIVNADSSALSIETVSISLINEILHYVYVKRVFVAAGMRLHSCDRCRSVYLS